LFDLEDKPELGRVAIDSEPLADVCSNAVMQLLIVLILVIRPQTIDHLY